MSNQIPDNIIKWCSEHKMCVGCPLHCKAPTNKNNYESWLKRKIEEVNLLIKEKSNEN